LFGLCLALQREPRIRPARVPGVNIRRLSWRHLQIDSHSRGHGRLPRD
jgi:hypothetical protein